jgi:hypothetical protein
MADLHDITEANTLALMNITIKYYLPGGRKAHARASGISQARGVTIAADWAWRASYCANAARVLTHCTGGALARPKRTVGPTGAG